MDRLGGGRDVREELRPEDRAERRSASCVEVTVAVTAVVGWPLVAGKLALKVCVVWL